MKLKIRFRGGADKYSRLEISINENVVGELTIEDKDGMAFIWKLMGECEIISV